MDYSEAKLLAFLIIAMGGRRRAWTTQARISRLTGLSQQSVSRVLRKLEERGYITRSITGRGELIEITPLGLERVEGFARLAEAIIESARDKLILEGMVVSGLGEGRYYVGHPYYSAMFERLLGFKPYPGTLNIRLLGESIWKRSLLDLKSELVVPGFKDEKREYGGAKLFPAAVNRYRPAAIVIPERTSHSRNVIEVVAPVCLRSALGLKDGDRVVLEVSLHPERFEKAQRREPVG
uniref:Riboflavin kinase n=1 Tax=Fervidicoccus fontis TaxID=683846 RepID=A0A7J3ZKF6_9CREN